MSNCQNCNSIMKPGDIFCRYCGHKQGEQTVTPTTSIPTPPAPSAPQRRGSSRYLKIANSLNDNALYNVAYAKANGLIKAEYPEEVEDIYEHLAMKNHLESMYQYAMIQLGKQPPNTDLAMKWLRLAASKGHAGSDTYLKINAPVTPVAPAPQSASAPVRPAPGNVLSGEEIYNKMEFAAVEILAIAGEDEVDRASGFIVSKHGFVVTNAHAILDSQGKVCKAIAVKLHDKVHQAVPVAFGSPSDGVHDSLDIALLFVPELKVKAVSDFGHSSTCRNGQKVYLIGNSLGCGTCITSGIISDASRKVPGLSYPYIMTDAAANPGNSGGPLLNEQGEVIGVLVAGIEKVKGMNYAIPIDVVKKFFSYISEQTGLDARILGKLAAPTNQPTNMSFSDNLFKGLHLVLDIVAFILSII